MGWLGFVGFFFFIWGFFFVVFFCVCFVISSSHITLFVAVRNKKEDGIATYPLLHSGVMKLKVSSKGKA